MTTSKESKLGKGGEHPGTPPLRETLAMQLEPGNEANLAVAAKINSGYEASG